MTKSKRSLHWCRSISKTYLCTFYYSISQKVITLSGRRFITVSGVLLHYRAVITLSGVFYYIIGQLLQYRAFITLSVGTHDAIVKACVESGKECIAHTSKSGKTSALTGWNEFVKPYRDDSIFWHNIWKQCGSPRNAVVADAMRRARKEYHNSVRALRLAQAKGVASATRQQK